MELDVLNELLDSELNEIASQVEKGRRNAIKHAVSTYEDEPGEMSREQGGGSGPWTFTSKQGIKVSDLGNNKWEMEFEGQTEKGDYETILKKVIAAVKSHYAKRERKLD